MIIRYCKGCGAKLQDENPELAGFIPKISDDSKYCKRCFRLNHYNELPKIVATNDSYEEVIDNVIKKNGLIVFVVDIFQFKSTFNKKMIDKIRNKNVILVANKYDCFPKSTNVAKIVDWLSHECEKIFFKVDAIHIVSSKRGYFIEDLTNTIDLARKGRDVYFVGCANVGKSSLINALLKKNTSLKDDVISVSRIPGTTLNEINIPFFDDYKSFIDTPGLINEHDILNKLLPKTYESIMPSNEMKPKTFQITDGNSICLAGLASISFESCDRLSVITYTSNTLYIHRCKTEKLEDLFKNNLGKLLNPPLLEEKDNLEYVDFEYEFKDNNKRSIWFSGFGFVDVMGKCKIKIKLIKGTEVYITDAII